MRAATTTQGAKSMDTTKSFHPMNRYQMELICFEYNRRVSQNTDWNWNGAAAAMADKESDVAYYLADIAEELGWSFSQGDFKELHEFWHENFRGRLARLANFYPSTHGEV
jgi:hypothetical protein